MVTQVQAFSHQIPFLLVLPDSFYSARFEVFYDGLMVSTHTITKGVQFAANAQEPFRLLTDRADRIAIGIGTLDGNKRIERFLELITRGSIGEYVRKHERYN